MLNMMESLWVGVEMLVVVVVAVAVVECHLEGTLLPLLRVLT
jgi:hypothetical protein